MEKRMTHGEEDGDPLGYGNPVVWGPCERYVWHPEETAVSEPQGGPTLVFT